MQKATQGGALCLAIGLVMLVTFVFTRATLVEHDQAGGQQTVDLSSLRVVPPQTAFPTAVERAPDEDAGTCTNSAQPVSLSLPDPSLPGSMILVEQAQDIADEWMPSAGAFLHHFMEVRIDQVRSLELDYVRDLLGAELLEWPTYAPAVAGKGRLCDTLEMPAPEDALYLYERTKDRFSRLLAHWYVASELELSGLPEEVYGVHNQAARSELLAITRTRVPYPHWEFLIRLAELHFE